MSPTPKTIQTFLPGGDPQGTRVAGNLARPVGAGDNGRLDTWGVALGWAVGLADHHYPKISGNR